MRCLLKVRATAERVKESFHSSRVECFKRISYYFPPAYSDLVSLFFGTLSGFTELFMGWSGAFHCTYIEYIYTLYIIYLNKLYVHVYI